MRFVPASQIMSVVLHNVDQSVWLAQIALRTWLVSIRSAGILVQALVVRMLIVKLSTIIPYAVARLDTPEIRSLVVLKKVRSLYFLRSMTLYIGQTLSFGQDGHQMS